MLGFHVSREFGGAAGLESALAAAAEVSAKYKIAPCAQIYIAGPQSYRRLLTDADVKMLVDSDTAIVIHGAYVDNPWRVDNERSIENILYESKMAAKVAAGGIIIHLGRGAADDAVLENTMLALAPMTTILWLEINAAKSSDYTFETPEKIAALMARISRCKRRPRVGICVDTAHLWSCGVKISVDWCRQVAAIGYPMMLHLNDSAADFGAGIDRHESVSRGHIFGTDRELLRQIVVWGRENCKWIILERDEEDVETDLEIITRLR